MDLFKVQFDRIRQQLAGLTPSQKMLSGSLVAIMVMTMIWWSRYAGQPDWEPLFDQPLAQDELGAIEQQLTGSGIDHKMSADGKITVPADKKVQAMGLLAYSGTTPKSFVNGFDEMIKQSTAWDGQDRQSAIFNHGKELTLERIIAAMPPVKAATVIINPHSERNIGTGNVDPTASVSVTTKRGIVDKQLANAIANYVSGSTSLLTPNHVKVLLDKTYVPTQDNSAPSQGIAAENVLELEQAAEQSYVKKIENLLPQIEGLRVSVAAHVENATETQNQREYDKTKSLIEAQKIQSRAKEDVVPAAAANEPGTIPNTGASVQASAAGAPGRSNSDATDTTENYIAPGYKNMSRQVPAGQAIALGASVSIPRSYFARLARSADPSKKDPDETQIEKYITSETPKIQELVRACTQIKNKTEIIVTAYADLAPAEDHPNEIASASTMTAMLGGHVKEIVLGGLAVASLFMMSMIVRKGAPVTPITAAAVSQPAAARSSAQSLQGSEILAGEASDGSATLEGMELDDDSIKTQQMLSQVSELVGDSPDSAASLIKRWMNQR